MKAYTEYRFFNVKININLNANGNINATVTMIKFPNIVYLLSGNNMKKKITLHENVTVNLCCGYSLVNVRTAFASS